MSTATIEQRSFTTGVELRASDSGSIVAGHSPIWNRYSQNLGGFVEQVLPGACDQSIREGDVRCFFNHDASQILGRTSAGTLRLEPDEVGLRFEVDLPATTAAADLKVSMARGDIDGASFSFRTIEEEWGFTADDFPLRTLVRLKLYETGPVVMPAYVGSESGLRSEQRSEIFVGLAAQLGRNVEEVIEAAASEQLRDLMTADNETEERLRETRRASTLWLSNARSEHEARRT